MRESRSTVSASLRGAWAEAPVARGWSLYYHLVSTALVGIAVGPPRADLRSDPLEVQGPHRHLCHHCILLFFFFFLHFTLIWVFFFSVNLSPLDKLLYPQGVTLSSGKEWCHATLDGWLRKILSSLGSWPGKTCPFPLCKEKSVATRQAHGSLAGEQATSQKKGTTVRNYVTLLTKANQRSCI